MSTPHSKGHIQRPNSCPILQRALRFFAWRPRPSFTDACQYDPGVSNEFAFEIYMIFALRVNKLSGRSRRGPTLRTTPANPHDRYDKCVEYYQSRAATFGKEDQQGFTATRLIGYESGIKYSYVRQDSLVIFSRSEEGGQTCILTFGPLTDGSCKHPACARPSLR